MRAHGVRTVVDLRNEDELGGDAAPRPAVLTTLHVALDGIEDRELLGRLGQRAAVRHAALLRPTPRALPRAAAPPSSRAVARAPPGGVAVPLRPRARPRRPRGRVLSHARRRRPGGVAADHALSAARLPPLFARPRRARPGRGLDRFLAGRGTTAAAALQAALDGLDLPALLRAGGLTDGDLAALDARVAGP